MLEQEVLLPPHEPLLKEYSTFYHAPAFINKYFNCSVYPDYPNNILSSLRSTHSQSYDGIVPILDLLKRTWLMAAEYGFPDVSGHQAMHKNPYQKKLTDPLHVVALAVYLAKRLTIVNEIKSDFLASNDLSYPQTINVWAASLQKSSQEPQLSVWLETITKSGNLYGRAKPQNRLPVLIPDRILHKTISQFNFNGEDAEKMSGKDFKSAYFPEIKNAFSPFCDLEKIIDD